MENNTKETVVRVSLFFAIVFSAFVILAAVTIPIDFFKNASIRQSVQNTLDAQWPGTYAAGARVDISAPMTVSAYAYQVNSSVKTDFSGTAVLIRVTGISGPVPVVFLKQDDQPAIYAGVSGMDEPVAAANRYGLTESVLQYWQTRVTDLPLGEIHE